jgi:nitroimidazol reductase NimA-like FMN-containing flavoprotein (pyridoxamine 5'-phosphate oxidase superfamily)
MVYARDGDHLILHGSAASRLLESGKAGMPLCVTVTLLDGLVFARSAFHHSMNYRSVVVLGAARPITEEVDKRRALDRLLEHLCRGRSGEVRPPNALELRATSVLGLPIDEASVKVRSGGPKEEPGDENWGCWGGVVPLELTPKPAISDEGPPHPTPNAIEELISRGSRRLC